MWICRQHGKDCQSYVTDIVEKWNERGYKPGNIPKDQQQFEKCVEWVKE